MFTPLWNLIGRVAARPAVADWLIRRAQRTPYSPIIKNGELYMDRYWLFNPYPDTGESGADKPRWQFPISIRIHHIVRPDQDRHMHDHPWNARTMILRGWYTERRREEQKPSIHNCDRVVESLYRRIPGDTAPLKFGEYHCVTEVSSHGAWTLFITGRYRGTWGFMVNGGKVPYRQYLDLPSKSAPPTPEHTTHRPALMEIAVIYGVFIALAIWNWW